MMQLLSPFQWAEVFIAFAVLLLIWVGPSLLSGFSGFKWPSFGRASQDDDALDLQAFRRLQARYVRLGCKEGQDAMDVAGQHFLHGTGGP